MALEVSTVSNRDHDRRSLPPLDPHRPAHRRVAATNKPSSARLAFTMKAASRPRIMRDASTTSRSAPSSSGGGPHRHGKHYRIQRRSRPLSTNRDTRPTPGNSPRIVARTRSWRCRYAGDRRGHHGHRRYLMEIGIAPCMSFAVHHRLREQRRADRLVTIPSTAARSPVPRRERSGDAAIARSKRSWLRSGSLRR